MRTLYLDCGMGAAGDMLAAALLELLPDPEGFVRELNELGIPGVEITRDTGSRCGITGTFFHVKVKGVEEESGDHAHPHGDAQGHGEHTHAQGGGEESDHHHHHQHRTMEEITGIISALHLPEAVEGDVLEVYRRIAQAESQVHGVPVTEIHFHEVGTMDAIGDITAVCLLMHRLAPERVLASPVHVGWGQVHCAHGILPVPAPATARILQDVPIYGGEIRGELTTPTGAALLKQFVTEFGPMPVMRTEAMGYGLGRKEFPAANVLRAMLGETEDRGDQVLELECNLDDMSGEEMGFALERCFEAGALDAWTESIGMKKSRPGTKLQVICPEELGQVLVETLFRHTTTLGIREHRCRRYRLEREAKQVDTEYGVIRRKDASGYGVVRCKYEYEDLARIAREQGLSIAEVRARLPELPQQS